MIHDHEMPSSDDQWEGSMKGSHTKSMTRPSLFWILYDLPAEHIYECIEGDVHAWRSNEVLDCFCYTGLA
jgi:hypothetical protein